MTGNGIGARAVPRGRDNDEAQVEPTLQPGKQVFVRQEGARELAFKIRRGTPLQMSSIRECYGWSPVAWTEATSEASRMTRRIKRIPVSESGE